MAKNDMKGTEYTFESIFQSDQKIIIPSDRKIIIPMIQREYVQGDDNVIATEIRDNILNEFGKVISETEGQEISKKIVVLDYIYGIVRDETIIPMDGQQRLTTLYLLYWYAAVRENVAQEKCSFLQRFSYETRYVVRDFCERLCGCLETTSCFKIPDSAKINISDIIRNQVWFIPEWQNNPTVAGMLRMLDAIHQKFNETAKEKNLWKALNNIKFYFLTIDDDKLNTDELNTDEFYIKMNSRGKELSDFEIFKAEMEGKIKEYNQEKQNDIVAQIDEAYIAAQIDGAWTEWIWKCRSNTDENGDIDNMFLNYFHFVFDIICYKKEKFPEKWGDDIFEKFRVLFLNEDSKPNDCFQENISTLTDYFDCWCQIPEVLNYNKPEDFFIFILSNKKSENKQSSNKQSENNDIINDTTNLLKECLYHYQIKNKEEFTLQNLILLYACIIYLCYNRKTEQEKKIDKEEFYCRFRIVNNLVRNSDNEINEARIEIESARRGKNVEKCSRMHNMLKVVENIILCGSIEENTADSFNEYQLQEEKDKWKYLKKYLKDDPENTRRKALYKLEDHELLLGQIGILRSENLDDCIEYKDRFCSLFQCDKDKVACALMTKENYGYKIENNLVQYGLSCGNNIPREEKAWRTLFHRFKIEENGAEDKTKKALHALLEEVMEIKDEFLDGLIHDYKVDCIKHRRYPFQYYYIKYNAFRPMIKQKKGYGRMWFPDDTNEPYTVAVLESEKQPGPNSYDPFLKEVFDSLRGQEVDSQKADSQEDDNQKIDSQKVDSQEIDSQEDDSQKVDSQEDDNQKIDSQEDDIELTDYNYNKRNAEEYNQYLKYGDYVVASRNDKYVIFKVKSTSEETDGEQCVELKKGSEVKKYVKLKEKTIPQDEDGIDTVDRIALLLQNIKKYLSLSAENTKCSSEN